MCGVGRALTHPLGAVSRRDPHKALVISETVAALCAEADAWEADLHEARAMQNLKGLGEARSAEAIDADLLADRHHTLAAARFDRAWNHMLQAWPEIGELASPEDCPRVRERDEIVVLLGMVSGVLALLHDAAGGGTLDVPLDRPLDVARGTWCVPEESLWFAPEALQAGAWATVPGSGPEGVDPWAELAAAADRGDATGLRLARAIQVLIAANAGKTEVVANAIRTFSAVEAAPDPDWILLDEYARLVVVHESDLVWTKSSGHRTVTLGVLPGDEETRSRAVDDAIGSDDPFGADDPFGEPASDETEEESP